MKKLFFILLLVSPLLLLAEISVNVSIPQWNLTRTGQDAMLPLLAQPGCPEIPFFPVKVLIPMGEKIINISVVINRESTTKRNISLGFVSTPQPISRPITTSTDRNEVVWQTNADYPTADYKFLGTQQWKGYQIAMINVYAWHYNPVMKQLSSSTNVEIKIQTTGANDLRNDQNLMLSTDAATIKLLNNLVINPECRQTYHKTVVVNPHSRLINLSNPKQLIIITSQNKIEWFTDYINWKASKGIPTGIYAIEDILSEYTGVDNPAKLRNFILDAYQNWTVTSTPLQEVILGGDDEIIPIRGVYGHVGDTIDEWMPCDLYYGCLDGSWNADGDNRWGEYPSDQPDLMQEVSIGRFPAETQVEFQNIMRKTRYYVDNNTYTNNMVNLYGENLNWNPVTWGGDYKDDVALHIPLNYSKNTYYQRDGTYTPEIVWNTMNDGAAIMNHMGHANQTYLMGQSNSSIEALQNTEYGFLYSQGCYPAAFDQRTSGAGESIGEHLVTASGALFAFIGNTRYGWYMPGSIDGASEYFDRQFFVGMYEQNMHKIGNAMEYSLLQNVNAAMDDDVMLWCYYETILFGDPTVSVKLANPELPCLSLVNYRFDDVDGDGDGNLNPGELIRIYPTVRNLAGWGSANNVHITISGLPEGVQAQVSQLNIPQIQPGNNNDTSQYLSFLLPATIPFGTYDFYLNLTAANQGESTFLCSRKSKLSMNITLLDSRFPWDCFYAGKSAPVVGDLQYDDNNQILYVDVFGDMHFINSAGQEVNSYNLPDNENINRSFAVGTYESVNTLMRSYAFTSRTGRIYAIAHKDTTTINFIDYDTDSVCLYTPVMANLNADATSEVIASAINKKIYAIGYDNQPLPGFPVTLPAVTASELAVADLDGNNTKEIIAGTSDGNLWVIENTGDIKAGFPVQLSGSVTGSPLILDNNNIVVGTNNNMYIIAPQGTILATCPISDGIVGGAIPVDLNRDSSVDIVFLTGSGQLCAYKQDGSEIAGFPVNIGGFFNCPPLAADVDGDNQYEIIAHNNMNCIYIYNNDGTPTPGYPFTMTYNGSTPATLTDFDSDGNYELITGYSNGVLVIKLRRPLGNMDAWTTYRGSLSRAGSYAATGFVENEDNLAANDDSYITNYPNPFNPVTTISYNLPKASQHVSLVIYNAKGQKVKTLQDGKAEKGMHKIRWNGMDENNKQVGNGVYYYLMQTTDKTLSGKMLLLK